MNLTKRRENERKFGNWEDLPNDGRRYHYDLPGRKGWSARYIKEVNSREETILYAQEIYDTDGHLVERHQKFPIDTGHQKIES